jgi:tRNA1Val (adenine37-N6)-methyltransferase
MNSVFNFRQFSIHHDQCAMKVGTDAVLLGAYARVQQAKSALDIGTGSGVIAIMIAQRCDAIIDAVESHEPSALQATLNAASCPWSTRVRIIQSRFQDFWHKSNNKYDLIICNPPFFPDHLRSPDHARNLTRHNVDLSFNELINGAYQLLQPEGDWWLILPHSESDKFLNIAAIQGFSLKHELLIHPKAGKKPHRRIIGLGLEKKKPVSRASLTIRNTDESFTNEYIATTRDFYISF